MMPGKLQLKQDEGLEGQGWQQPAHGPKDRAHDLFPFMKSVGRQFAHEVRQVCRATWDQPFRVTRYLRAWRRRRDLRRAFSDAQQAAAA
jgi:hypothetical protein